MLSPSQIDDSIIADNIGAGSTADPNANCVGAVPTGTTFDLTFPAGTGCPGMTGDPHLAALADNGGPTQTLALGSGSAAIDKIPTAGAGCPVTDQRGIARPSVPPATSAPSKRL